IVRIWVLMKNESYRYRSICGLAARNLLVNPVHRYQASLLSSLEKGACGASPCKIRQTPFYKIFYRIFLQKRAAAATTDFSFCFGFGFCNYLSTISSIHSSISVLIE
ncbi:MAG TPA: hypothetical protein VEL11_01360, partial [Candidatus Bathyarchaeia archaeon]|nr:hypothetical protein [Candidatus Bathyarchaeia archaeon]